MGDEKEGLDLLVALAPNQQIEPSVDWLLKNKGKDFFLVGSDYVFPRTANTIIKAQLAALGGKTVGEDYIPLGHTEVKPVIAKTSFGIAVMPRSPSRKACSFNSRSGSSWSITASSA